MDGDLFSWTFKIEEYEFDSLYEKYLKQYPEVCFVCINYLTLAKIRLTTFNNEHSLCMKRISKHYRTKTKLELELGVSSDELTGKIIFDPLKLTEKTAKFRDVYIKFLMVAEETVAELDFLYGAKQNSAVDYKRLLKNVRKCKNRHHKVCF